MTETTPLLTRGREAMTRFLWDQWCSVGIGGHFEKAPVGFAIDLEALILASSEWGQEDPRLRDESAAWLVQFGKLVSVQRLKSLRSLYQFGGDRVELGCAQNLDQVARLMVERNHRNWRSLYHESGEEEGGGWVSNFKNRELSQQPDTRAPENFLIKMRTLFGVKAHAEIITWLLTHDAGNPATIYLQVGWPRKTVQNVLNDLLLSGLVVSQNDGRQKNFILDPKSHIFHPDFASEVEWLNQPYLYRAFRHVMDVLEKVESEPGRSEQWQSAKIRGHLTAIKIAFERLGHPDFFASCLDRRGSEMVENFYEETSKFFFFLENKIKGITL